jgi:hypothetical protein
MPEHIALLFLVVMISFRSGILGGIELRSRFSLMKKQFVSRGIIEWCAVA